MPLMRLRINSALARALFILSKLDIHSTSTPSIRCLTPGYIYGGKCCSKWPYVARRLRMVIDVAREDQHRWKWANATPKMERRANRHTNSGLRSRSDKGGSS